METRRILGCLFFLTPPYCFSPTPLSSHVSPPRARSANFCRLKQLLFPGTPTCSNQQQSTQVMDTFRLSFVSFPSSCPHSFHLFCSGILFQSPNTKRDSGWWGWAWVQRGFGSFSHKYRWFHNSITALAATESREGEGNILPGVAPSSPTDLLPHPTPAAYYQR